jgi:hypothetical protein
MRTFRVIITPAILLFGAIASVAVASAVPSAAAAPGIYLHMSAPSAAASTQQPDIYLHM